MMELWVIIGRRNQEEYPVKVVAFYVLLQTILGQLVTLTIVFIVAMVYLYVLYLLIECYRDLQNNIFESIRVYFLLL